MEEGYINIIKTPMPDNSYYGIKENNTKELIAKGKDVKRITVTDKEIVIHLKDGTIEIFKGE